MRRYHVPKILCLKNNLQISNSVNYPIARVIILWIYFPDITVFDNTNADIFYNNFKIFDK